MTSPSVQPHCLTLQIIAVNKFKGREVVQLSKMRWNQNCNKRCKYSSRLHDRKNLALHNM